MKSAISMKHYFYLFVLLFCLCSCTHVLNLSTKNKNHKEIDKLCSYGINGISVIWLEENPESIQLTDGFVLPKQFHVYFIESDSLNIWFKEVIKKHKEWYQFSVPLYPAGGEYDCITFEVKLAEIMDKNLQNKYPELISLKGQNKKNTIRLNYNGKEMSGQVLWNEEEYYIQPLNQQSGTYYLIYNKKDVEYEKLPFE